MLLNDYVATMMMMMVVVKSSFASARKPSHQLRKCITSFHF